MNSKNARNPYNIVTAVLAAVTTLLLLIFEDGSTGWIFAFTMGLTTAGILLIVLANKEPMWLRITLLIIATVVVSVAGFTKDSVGIYIVFAGFSALVGLLSWLILKGLVYEYTAYFYERVGLLSFLFAGPVATIVLIKTQLLWLSVIVFWFVLVGTFRLLARKPDIVIER